MIKSYLFIDLIKIKLSKNVSSDNFGSILSPSDFIYRTNDLFFGCLVCRFGNILFVLIKMNDRGFMILRQVPNIKISLAICRSEYCRVFGIPGNIIDVVLWKLESFKALFFFILLVQVPKFNSPIKGSWKHQSLELKFSVLKLPLDIS